MLAADYPFLILMWTMLIFFLWFLWIWLLFTDLRGHLSPARHLGWGQGRCG